MSTPSDSAPPDTKPAEGGSYLVNPVTGALERQAYTEPARQRDKTAAQDASTEPAAPSA